MPAAVGDRAPKRPSPRRYAVMCLAQCAGMWSTCYRQAASGRLCQRCQPNAAQLCCDLEDLRLLLYPYHATAAPSAAPRRRRAGESSLRSSRNKEEKKGSLSRCCRAVRVERASEESWSARGAGQLAASTCGALTLIIASVASLAPSSASSARVVFVHRAPVVRSCIASTAP